MERVTRDSIWNNVVNNTCSFETSKKLWEADIKLVNSICSYISHGGSEFQLNYFIPYFILNMGYEGKDIGWKAYPAPNSDDLEHYITKDTNKNWKIESRTFRDEIWIDLWVGDEWVCANRKWHKNRVEALAEIALCLIGLPLRDGDK